MSEPHIEYKFVDALLKRDISEADIGKIFMALDDVDGCIAEAQDDDEE